MLILPPPHPPRYYSHQVDVFNFMDLTLRGDNSMENIVSVLRECSRVRMGGRMQRVYLLTIHSCSTSF